MYNSVLAGIDPAPNPPRRRALRILSLDIGTKTIGTAISDPSGTLARPLLTIQRTSIREDLEKLEQLIQKEEITLVLVGLPFHVTGESGEAVRRAEKIARKLNGRTGIPILGVDERYTTIEAEDLMARDWFKPSRRRKRDKDSVAAALIMQRYFEEGDSIVKARW